MINNHAWPPRTATYVPLFFIYSLYFGQNNSGTASSVLLVFYGQKRLFPKKATEWPGPIQ